MTTRKQIKDGLEAAQNHLNNVEMEIIAEDELQLQNRGSKIRQRTLKEQKQNAEKRVIEYKNKLRGFDHQAAIDKNNYRAVHVITSAKGGVGKTLLALVLSSIYSEGFRNRSMLGVDMNSMNPNYSKLLVSDLSKPLNKSADIEDFRLYEVADNVRVARPIEPYVVLDSRAFWHSISQLVKSSNQTDIIIDTNLYLANLNSEKSVNKGLLNEKFILEKLSIDELIKPLKDIADILLGDSGSGTVMYVWIIWTWDSLKEELENGTGKNHGESTAQLAISNLSSLFQNRIAFLHIFNPSALMLPNKPVPNKDKVKDIAYLESMRERYKSAEMPSKVDDMINTINTEVSDNFDIYSISGLQELSQLQRTDYIPFHEFSQIIPQHNVSDSKQAFINMCNQISTKFQGRPWNIFPISTYNPNLVGYIDNWSGSIHDFAKAHQRLIKDIKQYIQELELSNFEEM